MEGDTLMKKQTGAMMLRLAVVVITLGLMLISSRATTSNIVPANRSASSAIATEPQECSKCEGKCKAWIDKCKEGEQYACYKAAACLCKCNLDAGGCGSSKEALQECYEKNEKLAKELGPRRLDELSFTTE
jgi:hypothetical protein